MKCPKCGSTNISTERRLDGFNTCLKCGYKWKNGVEPKLTIAEMLLWLVENFNVNIRDDCGLEVYIEYRKNGRWIDYFVGDGYECKTLSEAIKQAYDWAKQEEQNAKN